MYTAVIPSVLLVGYLLSVNSTICKYYNSKIGFRNKKIRENCRWHHSHVPSLLKCAVECYADLNCRTFSFSHSKKVCFGYSKALDAYKNNMVDVSEGDTILFQTREGYTGSSCGQKDECILSKSMSVSCEPGLYYSPKDDSCNRSCSKYGKEMDVYNGRSISGHNKRFVYASSLYTCKQECVDEKSFLCLSFDFRLSDGRCHLADVGYMDVSEKERDQDDYWCLGQRRCK